MPVTWTHRPTWKDYRNVDRVVCRDGVVVARVYQHEHGPEQGHWSWFGQWVGVDNAGTVATLQEALSTLSDRCRKAW